MLHIYSYLYITTFTFDKMLHGGEEGGRKIYLGNKVENGGYINGFSYDDIAKDRTIPPPPPSRSPFFSIISTMITVLTRTISLVVEQIEQREHAQQCKLENHWNNYRDSSVKTRVLLFGRNFCSGGFFFFFFSLLSLN